MTQDNSVKKDRMRYTKDTLSANLLLFAIVADVLYFVNLYQSDVGSYFYNWQIGASVVYNLIFLLAAFLSSEGIKNYKIGYSYLMIALGIGQIIRIFIYPVRAHGASVTIQEQAVAVMENPQFIRCVLYLAISAACLFVGAFVGMTRSKQLKAHLQSLGAAA
jgi:hypothetical protein